MYKVVWLAIHVSLGNAPFHFIMEILSDDNGGAVLRGGIISLRNSASESALLSMILLYTTPITVGTCRMSPSVFFSFEKIQLCDD